MTTPKTSTAPTVLDRLIEHIRARGVVCLYAIRGKASGADRVRALLATAYGNRWSNQTEQELFKATSTGSQPTTDLATWLRDHFFPLHCNVFQNRPFMKVELRKGGKKGAGLLRTKPNIKWGKEQGEESP